MLNHLHINLKQGFSDMKFKKSMAASVLALSLAGAFATPATATEPDSGTNNQLKLYKAHLDDVANRLFDKYGDIIQMNEKAEKDNDRAMLAHTKPALEEITKRLENICTPLANELETAHAEQVKRHPGFFENPDESYKRLVSRFERECGPQVLPTIRRSQGRVISDVTLDRKAIHIMRLDVMIALNKRTAAANEEVNRSVETSGHIYVANARRYAQEMEKIRAACQAANPAYENFVNTSNDLIEIRRRKAAFEKICTKTP